MSVNPNESELTSVHVRITGGSDNAEDAVFDNAAIDLVLELEAGGAIFGMAPKYNLSVVLNDLSDSSTTIYAAEQADNQQAIGVMTVDVNDPQVELQQSELFVVTNP